MNAIGRLIFLGGIPPAVVMKDVARAREVQPRAAGFDRQDEEPGLSGLEALDHFVAFLRRDAPVEKERVIRAWDYYLSLFAASGDK